MTLNFSARLTEPYPPLLPPHVEVEEGTGNREWLLTLRLSFSYSGTAVYSATPLGPTDPDNLCCQEGGQNSMEIPHVCHPGPGPLEASVGGGAKARSKGTQGLLFSHGLLGEWLPLLTLLVPSTLGKPLKP